MGRITLLVLCFALPCFAQQAKPKPYRLPAVDLKKPIIWDTIAEGPDGTALAFGGQDQTSEDGIGHTRIRNKDGEWKDISAELRMKNRFEEYVARVRRYTEYFASLTHTCRLMYFGDDNVEFLLKGYEEVVQVYETDREALVKELALNKWDEYQARQIDRMKTNLSKPLVKKAVLTSEFIESLRQHQQRVSSAAEFLSAEPAPRALTGLVYDPKTKLYVLFGGDHLDYLTNDTWVFDPAKTKWEQRHPKTAPTPRANHKLKANGDGTITLTGGYTYANNTDYMGGQYIDHNDGDWVYNVAENTWTAKTPGVEPNQRLYRKGPFVPSYFLEGDKPDPKAFAEWQEKVPVNTWKKTNPPKLPHMQRDWGTAVLDPDHDMILRWSGGHCAHGGTDVLHYHLGTNRWELCYPVEFPLGQLYTNTEYPAGWNFNKRPWITGHTYQSYGYDTFSKKMVFVGQQNHSYVYDPMVGDWVSRAAKPKGLNYGSAFFTLTVAPTKQGLVCWTQEGKLFQYVSDKNDWTEVKLEGEKLQGSVVDNSTLVYDAKRDRLLFFRKGYGDKAGYDGKLQEVDWKTKKVRTITPKNAEAASVVPYLCQIRYDVANDVLLVGGTFAGADGVRRAPVYDCAKDEWGSVKLVGDDPNGKNGRNVSLGLMYEEKRKQFWAVDTYSQVYVLKFDLKSADYKVLAKD